MKVSEIVNSRDLRPLKIAEPEVPHAVIETNYTCNRRCRFCYNRFRDIVKPLEQIQSEIDQAMAKRKLETISILGGEPTLHPHLPEVVRYIKERHLVCQILTNGVVLSKPSGNALLDNLVDVGLDRVIVHVDSGQGLDERQVEEMRTTLFKKFEERKLFFALSLTVSNGESDAIPAVMKRYAHYRYFDGVLVTVARDMAKVARCANASNGSPDLSDVYVNVSGGLHVEPSSYIPSSLDDQEVRWLVYFYYLNVATGASVSISPAFARLMRRAYRFLTGKHLFAAPMNPSLSKLWFVVTWLLEVLRGPAKMREFVHLAKKSSLLREIRFQYIVAQSGPQFNAEKGVVEMCYHCPDATIRNGKLLPVCLADWISPPGKYSEESKGEPSVTETVYAHLEEALP
jgi:uncharacterized Fe-S cluster-containing radical SAM superfamily protein